MKIISYVEIESTINNKSLFVVIHILCFLSIQSSQAVSE